MEPKITTEKVGLITISTDGELTGVIYNDIKTRTKRLFKCVPMDEDEISALIGNTVESNK